MPASPPSSDPRHILGRHGEQAAELHYVHRGYRCIARNWRHGRAEIDRILVREDSMVILEVKTRRNSGAESIGSVRQWRRIAHAGMRFAQQQRWSGELRLDLVIATLNHHGTFEIRIIRNIWEGWG